MGREQLFVGTDAVDAGTFTQRELSTRCDRIYRNVYARKGSPLTARDRAVAAWLWSGKNAVLAVTLRLHLWVRNGSMPLPGRTHL
jgi:hypothetical protein